MSTHKVLSYAKRIDEICLGEWWQSKRWLCVSRILVAIQIIMDPEDYYEEDYCNYDDIHMIQKKLVSKTS
ncbi:hypothetical protein F4W09_03520 [Acinetobacter tandoii]|uniref:Uncharacterized protein n=1 Tax=Acinetobacter tandoii TaxID=202954 RepID=A0A5N4WJB9_9GAMM|nr:hypothetical protein F4W09_03520 [Acinetobacter tandoii]